LGGRFFFLGDMGHFMPHQLLAKKMQINCERLFKSKDLFRPLRKTRFKQNIRVAGVSAKYFAKYGLPGKTNFSSRFRNKPAPMLDYKAIFAGMTKPAFLFDGRGYLNQAFLPAFLQQNSIPHSKRGQRLNLFLKMYRIN